MTGARVSPPSNADRHVRSVETLQQWQLLRRAESQMLDKIGNQSNLDVDGVIVLCDKVINTARDDLRGRYGNE